MHNYNYKLKNKIKVYKEEEKYEFILCRSLRVLCLHGAPFNPIRKDQGILISQFMQTFDL